MTDIARLQHWQVGLAASATDLTTTPTMSSIEPLEITGGMPRDQNRVERDLMRGDNRRYASIIGTKDVGDLGMTIQARGVSTNDGGSIDAQTDTELGYLLDSAIGVDSVDKSSGSATTIASDTGSTGTLVLTSATGFVTGGGVLFKDGNGDYVAREITNVVTNTLTLDRDHTDGAPHADDAVPYGAVMWTLPESTVQHKPLWIRGIGTNWERTYIACTCSGLRFEVSEGEPGRFIFTWVPNDWSDTTVAPSFSAPTAGDYAMGTNSALYIGESTKLLVRNVSLDYGLTAVPRTTINGTNGKHGMLVTRKEPVLTATLYFGGSGLSFGEVKDTESGASDLDFNKIAGMENAAGTALNKGQTSATYDLALQVGAGPGRTAYFRMPAAELRGRVEQDNGIEVIRLTAVATRPSSGTMLRTFLF